MGDRDVRVVYKSRLIPKDSDDRPRIPTALDPYDHPYGDETFDQHRARRDRERSSRNSSATNLTMGNGRSPRSSYSVNDKRGSRENFGDVDRSRYNDSPTHRSSRGDVRGEERYSRKSIVLDQDRERRPSSRPNSRSGSQYQRGSDVNNRSRGNGLEYVVDGGVRRDGGAYILDTRGEIEIVSPSRGSDRDYDGRGPRYVYESMGSRDRTYYDDRNSTPASQGRAQSIHNGQPRSSRVYHQDDDLRIVDSMRDTRLESTQPRENQRSRRGTRSSGDGLAMVATTQAAGQTVRSSLQRTDYAPSELRRRRSRSISFRESQAAYHDEHDKRHERPGAEAELCGSYLRSRPDQEEDSDIFSSYSRARTPSRSRGREYAAAVYHDTQDRRGGRHDDQRERYHGDRNDDRYREPYPPQQDNMSRRRERSRHRPRGEDDDESFVSENVKKTYIKKTTYL